MSFQLPVGEEKHAYVHDQFERIARRYDITNNAISMGMHHFWKDRAVSTLLERSQQAQILGRSQDVCRELDGLSEQLEKSQILREEIDRHTLPARKFLDVCSGTGDLALKIANRVTAEDEVSGVDFSDNMLNVARARLTRSVRQKRVFCNVWFEAADAQELPFENNSFDGVIISFGLRNLTDLDRGLGEMFRVVKPGGCVVNLDLGKPTGRLFAPAFRLYFRHMVPIIGMILQNDRKAYTYLPESKSTYPDPDELTRRFENAGMARVEHQPLAGGSVALHSGLKEPVEV